LTLAAIAAGASRRRWFGAAECLGLAVVLAVATWMRLQRLDGLHYWFDESFTLRMAEYPPWELIERCTRDTHPPACFLLWKGWVGLFGSGVWWGRMLSVLWSLGAVATAFGFTLEALSVGQPPGVSRSRAWLAAVVSSGCLALSPLQITWAQQVRMYSQTACLAVLSTWLLWRACERPSARARWWAFGAVELLGLYTHVTFVFVFAAHLLALGVVMYRQWNAGMSVRNLASPAGRTTLLVGLLALPWMVVVRLQYARVRGDFWSQPLDMTLLGEAFVKCFTISETLVASPQAGLWIAQGIVLLLVLGAAGGRTFHLVTVLTAGTPIVLLVAVSFLDRNIVHPRYFIAGYSVLAVVVGGLAASLPGWPLRLAAAVLVLGTVGTYAGRYCDWRRAESDQRGLPGLLAAWRDHARPNEPLVFNNPMYHTTAHVYASEPSRMRIYGRMADFPFFNGTAATCDADYLSAAELQRSDWSTLWVCDAARGSRYAGRVSPGPEWRLVIETGFKDYSGHFILRRFDRRATIATTELKP
jgi:4-amino-4-deoxy-L-arabinose transferase-like glycosyltransferase